MPDMSANKIVDCEMKVPFHEFKMLKLNFGNYILDFLKELNYYMSIGIKSKESSHEEEINGQHFRVVCFNTGCGVGQDVH
jgi:hypothetical protein